MPIGCAVGPIVLCTAAVVVVVGFLVSGDSSSRQWRPNGRKNLSPAGSAAAAGDGGGGDSGGSVVAIVGVICVDPFPSPRDICTRVFGACPDPRRNLLCCSVLRRPIHDLGCASSVLGRACPTMWVNRKPIVVGHSCVFVCTGGGTHGGNVASESFHLLN